MLLFVVVPIAHRLARGGRAQTVATLVVTVGAATAVWGVVQYGVLEYDNLGRRPDGTMGHYMTYSGLLVLTISLAAARVLFDPRRRLWSALVMPALLDALAVTLTRSYWVGAGAAVAVLCLLKDLRLMAVVPCSRPSCSPSPPRRSRAASNRPSDLEDPTVRDRFAMARAGMRIIREPPLDGGGAGHGAGGVPRLPRRRGGAGREPPPPQRAGARRGRAGAARARRLVPVRGRGGPAPCPASPRRSGPPLAAAGLAAVAGMLSGGLFEYNFGDSEFLMLFLVILALPAGGRPPAGGPSSRGRIPRPAPAPPHRAAGAPA